MPECLECRSKMPETLSPTSSTLCFTHLAVLGICKSKVSRVSTATRPRKSSSHMGTNLPLHHTAAMSVHSHLSLLVRGSGTLHGAVMARLCHTRRCGFVCIVIAGALDAILALRGVIAHRSLVPAAAPTVCRLAVTILLSHSDHLDHVACRLVCVGPCRVRGTL